MIHKTDLIVSKAAAAKDDVYEFVASTDGVDRQGDIVEQKFETTKFRKNPVFLWGHDQSGLPIGKVTRVWTQSTGEKAAGKAKRETRIQVQFVPDDIYPFAGQVKRLYESGHLKAVSIGFRPLEFKPVSADERKELGMGMWGQRIAKSELLEVSAVSVPANADALQAAVTKGLMSKDCASQMKGVDPADGYDRDAVQKALDAIDAAMEIVNEEPNALGAIIEPDISEVAQLIKGIGDLKECVQILVGLHTKDAEGSGEAPTGGVDEPGGEESGSSDQGEELSEADLALVGEISAELDELGGKQ